MFHTRKERRIPILLASHLIEKFVRHLRTNIRKKQEEVQHSYVRIVTHNESYTSNRYNFGQDQEPVCMRLCWWIFPGIQEANKDRILSWKNLDTLLMFCLLEPRAGAVCRTFSLTLRKGALRWFSSLPSHFIEGWDEFSSKGLPKTSNTLGRLNEESMRPFVISSPNSTQRPLWFLIWILM